MEDVNKRRRISFSLSKLECGPQEINSREIRLQLPFSANWNKRADGDQRSQIKKHVVVSVRSNLPQKSLTVLSEPKFGPPPPTPIKNSWILSWDQLQQERVSSLGC